jgi:uncharacterized protein
MVDFQPSSGMILTMYARAITENVRAALDDTPAVLVHGARQVGKTTLARTLVRPDAYFTLDNAATQSAAVTDPAGFVEGLGDKRVVIDEVQRAPELFRALKERIDRSRVPGQFLLTGSANVLALPSMSESLAGRMEIITMWPLAEQELEGCRSSFVDRLIAKRAMWPSTKSDAHIVDRILRGGYPEAVQRSAAARRRAWFASYITTILQRDIRDISNIEGLAILPRLLSLLATRSSALLNFADLSRSLSIPQSTLKRYFALLDATHLVRLLPAWSSNLGLRLAKAPKLLITDAGLCAHLAGADAARIRSDGNLFGTLLETFVTTEVLKQASWHAQMPSLFHFRTSSGQEVDLVLEDPAGRIVGIEIKATRSVTSSDFNGLRALSHAAGKRFLRGVLLALNDQVVPFGSELTAVPIPSLWTD